jgi:hypothetical protein
MISLEKGYTATTLAEGVLTTTLAATTSDARRMRIILKGLHDRRSDQAESCDGQTAGRISIEELVPLAKRRIRGAASDEFILLNIATGLFPHNW